MRTKFKKLSPPLFLRDGFRKTQKRKVAAQVENLHWIPPPLRQGPPPAPPPVTLVREAASSQHSRGAGVQDALHLTLQEAGLAREATATTQQASSNLWSHLRQESASLRGISHSHTFRAILCLKPPRGPTMFCVFYFHTPALLSTIHSQGSMAPTHDPHFSISSWTHVSPPDSFLPSRHTNLLSKSNPSYIKGPPFPTLTLSNFLQVTETQTPEIPTIPLSVPFIPKSICFNSKS